MVTVFPHFGLTLAVIQLVLAPIVSSLSVLSLNQRNRQERVIRRMTDSTGDNNNIPMDLSANPCILPGDPSLNLVTNLDLGDKKLDIMKGERGFVFLSFVSNLIRTNNI